LKYINLLLVSDKEITDLNKKYLKRNYATDVLSFEYSQVDAEGDIFVGDVVVSLDRAKEQAKDYKNSFEQEVAELAGHGVLHLLGVHHKADDENSVHGVNRLGLKNPQKQSRC
jgi:probable rRNA maturation factor